VKTVEYKKGQEAKEIKTEAGIKYVEAPAENRVRVFYPGKPAPEVIKELKGSGFRGRLRLVVGRHIITAYQLCARKNLRA